MNLSDQQIQNFIEAWRKDFGEALSAESAEKEATRQLDFFMQMEEGLRSQRTQADRPDHLPDDQRNLKAVWENTMRDARHRS